MSTPYRNLDEDHISVDSAGSQSDAAKFSSKPTIDGDEYNVEVVGRSDRFPKRSSRLKSSWKFLLLLFVIIFFALFLIILVVELASRGSDGWNEFRLPKDVAPSRYEIFLHPNFENRTVNGSVTILLNVLERTNFIVIHAKAMILKGATLVKDGTEDEIDVEPPAMNDEIDTAFLRLGRYLDKGSKYQLTISFYYNLTDSLSGFYVSSYKESNISKNLDEDHISVDSAGSQSDAAKFSSKPTIDGDEYNVEVVGRSDRFPKRSSRLKSSWKFLLLLFVIIFFALFLIILVVELASRGSDGWNEFRLPKDVAPSRYEIFLHPNFENRTVNGSVTILLNVLERTNFIVIHAKAMILKGATLVKDGTEDEIDVEPPAMNDEIDTAFLRLGRYLDKGSKYQLTISFYYNLTDSLSGFYVSSYKESNISKDIGSTQMEPLSARKAFPCFDEPAFKANFSLKLVHKPSYNVTLFNTPLAKEREPYPPDNSLLLDTFETTVSMSTYLVAFVICEFTNLKTTTSNGTKVAIYSRGAQQDQMDLALDVLNETIPFYESFFNVSYPLEKQDMVAIPNFEAGAMENWGLILYREADLLYKEGITKSSQQQRIVIVITHELAHQWFGNLVTMKWWDDLWLNEGFASYMEYVGCDHYKPEWKMLDQFFLETSRDGLDLDSLSDSHPVSVEVRDSADINARFDRISYSKGASIIRMLSDTLGDDVFKKGLHVYLRDNAYGNTATVDLWNAFTAVADKSPQKTNVTKLMDYWTLQMGFPLVNITREGSKVKVSQEQFLIYPKGQPSDAYDAPFNYKWMIPLDYTYYSGSKRYGHKTISADEDVTVIDITETFEWIKGNNKQFGFYRVNYDKKNWQALTDVLLNNHELLDPVDRAGIFDDAFHVFRADKIDMEIPFSMIDYLKNERDYVPFATALSNLGYLRKILQFRSSYGNFTTYLKSVLKPALDNLTLTDDGSHLRQMLRAELVDFLFKINDEHIFQWVEDNYENDSIGVNLLPILKCGGVMLGREKEWDKLWEQYKVNTIASENHVLLKALSCSRDPTILTRYLYQSLDDTYIQTQDSTYVISYVVRNPAGANLALHFFMENWDQLSDTYGDGIFTLTSLISTVTSWVSTPVQAEQVELFFGEKFQGATDSQKVPVRQAIERIKANVRFLAENEERMAKFFADKVANM